MISIKSYQLDKGIFVHFFEGHGREDFFACPKCAWSGTVHRKVAIGADEVCCPSCGTELGLIAAEKSMLLSEEDTLALRA